MLSDLTPTPCVIRGCTQVPSPKTHPPTKAISSKPVQEAGKQVPQRTWHLWRPAGGRAGREGAEGEGLGCPSGPKMQVCEPGLHTLGRKAPCTVLVLEDVTRSKLETDLSTVTQDQGENLSLWTPQPRAFLLSMPPSYSGRPRTKAMLLGAESQDHQ